MKLEQARVALVHDWLTGLRGGEKVLDCLAELFPKADLFTLFKTADITPAIDRLPTFTSPLQRLPGIGKYYRYCLPLYPWAANRLNLSGYDLVISSSHCVAKGAGGGDSVHISYIHTPMRYVWDMYKAYFGPGTNPLVRAVMRPTAGFLRRWDVKTCSLVDQLASNSRHVADRIRRHWNRTAEVIPPPVEAAKFRIAPRGDYYLILSALAPYKQVDLAIEAANRAGFKLIVAGSGPDYDRLADLAGPTVELAGRVDDDRAIELYANCRAFIFPGEEDFGITPLEAMASGKPVVALGRGGVWDSVRPINPPPADRPSPGVYPPLEGPVGGVFFYQSTPEALIEAVNRCERNLNLFEPESLRRWSGSYDRSIFKDRFMELVQRTWNRA